jgi:hypothetical protein
MDQARAIGVDASGNVYVTGRSTSGTTGSDYATVKYSTSGTERWVRRYDEPTIQDDGASAMAVDDSGNVYVTGRSYGTGTTGWDYATIKYDTDGHELWVERYNGPGNHSDYARSIAVDDSGSVYVTGCSVGRGGYWDYATVKYDTGGNELWVERYNGSGNLNDVANAAAVHSSGTVYVTGNSDGDGTSADYATIRYGQPTCRNVGNITVCADSIIQVESNTYRAHNSVWIGDQDGQNFYLYLGDDAEVTFNVNTATVSSVVFGNVHLSVQWQDYDVDAIASLTIDAPAGQVSFQGTVHYSEDAIFQSSFSGACVLDVNSRHLSGSIQFDDSYFGSATVGVNAGFWDFEGCPFMGLTGEIELTPTAPVILSDNVDYLSLINGQITLGVFLNTGIFRVGLEHGALEFSAGGGAFGFNLTHALIPPGVPKEGTIDIDLEHLSMKVVKDIPIGLPIPLKDGDTSGLAMSPNSKLTRNHKGEKILLVDAGLTIKGEEPYTDINCNGTYEWEEPFVDENGNEDWDQGTEFQLRDDFSNPVIDAYGHAVLNLTLAKFVKLDCADAVVDIDFPARNTIDLEIWTGLQLGDIFTLDLATGILSLDFENRMYSADATVNNLYFAGTSFDAHLVIGFDPFQFETAVSQDFQILGVDVLGTGSFLRVDEDYLYLLADLNAFGLLEAEGRLSWMEGAIDGFFSSDLHVDGWHLAQQENQFHFSPGECMTITASLAFCPVPHFCPGGKVTFRICSFLNWGVVVNGKYFRLKCPADLHVYDSLGRHTGLNPGGGLDLEIPGSEFYFSEDSSQQLIFIPGFDLSDVYTIEVVGDSTGVIDLDVLYPNPLDSKAYDFTFFDQPTQQGALHRVILDNTNTWTMFHDLDSDSVFESQSEPDSSAEATLDTTMVAITDILHEIVCANEVNITWNTNVLASSEVLYRTENDSIYNSVYDTTLTTSHALLIDDILTTEMYYYVTVSVDSSGNIASFLEKTFSLNYVVGDVNVDGVLDLGDVVFLINYLFKGGPAPDPTAAGDCTCDLTVDVGDVVYLLNYLFKNGPPPDCH